MNGLSTELFPTEAGGFSLIEVMVSIAVGAILLGIVAGSFPGLNRMANRFLSQSTFAEEYLIFLIKVEDESRQADASDPKNLDAMAFYQDINRDGDYADGSERIAYRWNSKRSRLDRKSGKGYFQALLDGVVFFDWRRIDADPLCHRMTIRDAFQAEAQKITYCRTDLP